MSWYDEVKKALGTAADVQEEIVGEITGTIGLGQVPDDLTNLAARSPFLQNLGQGAIDMYKDLSDAPVYSGAINVFESGFGAFANVFGGLPDEAKAVFNASDVNPYDEAGRYRRDRQQQLADQQIQEYRILEDAENAAGWAALMARTGAGSAGRTVVDEQKLRMSEAAIEDTLMRGMAQISSQYTMMADQYEMMQAELDRRNAQARDEIDRSRLAAIESMTRLQQDMADRSTATQADIVANAARTGGNIEAATQAALSRLGTTSGVVSEGIRSRLAEEGQVERDLAASESDIQADLAARLGQISQDAMGRQRNLVETTASGSSAELANLVARISAERAAERAATEFELSEGARQRIVELVLNPPTKKVGGRAKGDLNKYALDLEVMKGLGFTPAQALAAVAGDYENDLIQGRANPQFDEDDFAAQVLAQASPEQQQLALEAAQEKILRDPPLSAITSALG